MELLLIIAFRTLFDYLRVCQLRIHFISFVAVSVCKANFNYTQNVWNCFSKSSSEI